jgi:hypothetical protein
MHRLTAPVPFITSEPKSLPVEFYERLIRFYAGQPPTQAIVSPIWEGCRQFTQDLVSALEAKDAAAVEADLSILFEGLRVFGLDWGLRMAEPDLVHQCQAQFEQSLFACAYAAGTHRAYNTEQPSGFEPVEAEELLCGLEKVLGFRLSHPGGGKMFGAHIGGRMLPPKFIPAVTSLIGMMRLSVWPPKRVLELGAGLGYLCYAMQRTAGPILYHIIDLPVIAVIQAYVLACAGYAESLYLSGEQWCHTGQHIFLHGLHYRDVRQQEFDLFVNQDSLPEIPVPVAHAYLETCLGALRPGGVFHSVNHESAAGDQVPVRELMECYPDMAPRVRSPFWGRLGWLEEVWVRC